jgi:hypothetical protein
MWHIKANYLACKIFFPVTVKILLINSSGGLTISLEACKEDTPIFPMPLKMGMVTPSFLQLLFTVHKFLLLELSQGFSSLSLQKRLKQILATLECEADRNTACAEVFPDASFSLFIHHQSPSESHLLWNCRSALLLCANHICAFNSAWTDKYFFTEVNKKCAVLVSSCQC